MNVNRPHRATVPAAVLCLMALGLATGTAHAQYPDRPITIIVPYAQGGPTDMVARPIVKEMSRVLGQPVELEFKGGQGATLAPRELMREGGDGGYKLLLHNIGMASAPTLYRQLGFDPTRDYLPVGLIADAPMMLLARKDFPVAEPAGFLPYIKRNERSLAVAYGGPGGAGALCGLMLEAALRVKLLWIPYTGTKPAIDDLARGRADLLCDQTTNAAKPLGAGAIKAYALTSGKRLEAMPDIPTTAELGAPGVEIAVWHALYAVRGTAPEVVDRLSAALQQAVASPEFVASMKSVGVIPATQAQATPAALRRHLASEIARWRPLIQATGQYAD
ncbi:MAG: tripartite tricarboxylate transporter substrate-binding protein [Lautropia sp.]